MKRIFTYFAAIFLMLGLITSLTGCGSTSAKRSGGYYKDDGPMASSPKNISNTPNATPRIEPFAHATLRPYQVMGMHFVPIADSKPFSQTGLASWYGKKFHGKKTATGERYDMFAMTAAHPTLPLPSYARVTRIDNNKSIIVRINDRGPFHSSRIIDLSYAAASKLDMIGPGKAQVHVKAITHDDIRTGRYQEQAPAKKQHAFQQQSNTGKQNTQYQRNLQADPLGDFLIAQEKKQTTDSAHHRISNTTNHQIMTEHNDGFFLQFGAFRSADRAQQLAHQVNTSLKHDLANKVHINNRQDLFRVRLGPFNSRTEAVNAAMLVQQATGQNAQITYED